MTLSIEQFKKIATRDDLTRVEHKVDDLDNKFSQILTAIDGLTKKVDSFTSEMAANISAHDRFSRSISNIEYRIDKVEYKIEIKTASK